MANGNGKVKDKVDGNGHNDQQAEIDSLKAELKKEKLERKYNKVGGANGEFNADDFLFHDAQDGDLHKREVVTSDLPVRMVPLLTNWQTLTKATSIKDRINPDGSIKRLSCVWMSEYLLARKAVDRQARTEAVDMGKEKQEQDAMKSALKA